MKFFQLLGAAALVATAMISSAHAGRYYAGYGGHFHRRAIVTCPYGYVLEYDRLCHGGVAFVPAPPPPPVWQRTEDPAYAAFVADCEAHGGRIYDEAYGRKYCHAGP